MIFTNGSIQMLLGQPFLPQSVYPAQIRAFDVYFTQTPSSPTSNGVVVSWYPLSGAQITQYGVYRSIVGFVAPILHPADVAGKTLQLSINAGPVQTITFDGTTPVLDQFNLLRGASATPSNMEPAKFIYRVDPTSSPGILQIIGGTAMADFGLSAGTITKQSSSYFLGYVPASPNDDVNGVEFFDCDGLVSDSYRLTTVNLAAEESAPTAYKDAQFTTGALCWVTGIVTNPAGVRIPDTPVTARILELPQSVVPPAFINSDVIETITQPDGTFKISLLQGALVEILIPSIYYQRPVRIPMQSQALLSDLPVDRDYRSPLEVY
jgi:hypothetical protein